MEDTFLPITENTDTYMHMTYIYSTTLLIIITIYHLYLLAAHVGFYDCHVGSGKTNAGRVVLDVLKLSRSPQAHIILPVTHNVICLNAVPFSEIPIANKGIIRQQW